MEPSSYNWIQKTGKREEKRNRLENKALKRPAKGFLVSLALVLFNLTGCGGENTPVPPLSTPFSGIFPGPEITIITAQNLAPTNLPGQTNRPSTTFSTPPVALTPTQANSPRPTFTRSSFPTSTFTPMPPTLPVYSGLKPLKLGPVFEQALSQSLAGEVGGNTRYLVYSTADSSEKVVAYYDETLRREGFNKTGDQEVPPSNTMTLAGKLVAYQKGSGPAAVGAVIALLGPMDPFNIALLTSQSPSVSPQLKPGDYLVMVFDNLNTSKNSATLPSNISSGTTPKP